ncbi:hypothetical protein [Bdellovibrio sp.]|uniref:hypothetical protein n=1 Tax=Bdellovibrio sp. TaxID=28201 RepID=UPI0039E48EFB
MNFNYYAIWRGVHVLSVLLWIGGVAFVTLVLIPALRKGGGDYETFEKLEHRFGNQAKITTQLALISGLAMLWVTDTWARLLNTWWLWAMLLAWAMFTLMLFVLEPIVIHKLLHQRAQKDPKGTLELLQRLHYLLLAVGLVALVGGVIGAHGGMWF